MRETGSLKNKKRVSNFQNRDLDILLFFEENPNASIAKAVEHFQISFGLIQKILKKNKFFPYKIRPVQALSPVQIENRLNFAVYMTNRLNADPNFFDNILWTDESTFSTAGMFNRHNTRYWSLGNPHEKREIKLPGKYQVKVFVKFLQLKMFHNSVFL